MSRHRNQRLRWVSAEGDELFLDDPGDKLRLFALEGTGIPGTRHQVARTPNRDGETYLGDSFIDPRFITARCQVVGVGCWEDEAALRLALAAAFTALALVATFVVFDATDNKKLYIAASVIFYVLMIAVAATVYWQ